MNIKILINLLLIASLSVINMNGMDKKRKCSSYDDSVDRKKIKYDPEFEAQLAKEKKDLAEKNNEAKDKAQAANQEQNKNSICTGLLAKFAIEQQKESTNLSCTGLPTDVKKIISQYLERDWYLYSGRDLIYSKGHSEHAIYKIKEICYSDDNKSISIIGHIEQDKSSIEQDKSTNEICLELHKIFNLDTKSFEKPSFMRLLPKTLYSQQEKSTGVSEDTLGKYNNIQFSSFNADSERFRLAKEYFSMDLIEKGRFSLSPDEKYIAYANTNGFIIWDANRLKGDLTIGSILKKYDINPENDDRSKSWVNCLSFSQCSNYLAINVNLDNEGSLSFIYDLVNDTLLDLSSRRDIVNTLTFSPDGRYFVIGGWGYLRIFKRGFE